jgi:site-specific recombinase XerD
LAGVEPGHLPSLWRALTMTFFEAIKIYLESRKRGSGTRKVDEYYLRQLCLFLQNPLLREVKEEHILNYFRLLETLGWDRNTLVGKAVVIRLFFAYWHKRDLFILDPEFVPTYEREFRFPKVADPEQVQKILNALSEDSKDASVIRDRALIFMIWDTGARLGEVLSLNVSQLRFEGGGGSAVVKTEKRKINLPARVIVWHERTQRELDKWLNVRDRWVEEEDALFVGLKGGNVGRRITVMGAGEIMRRRSREVGIPTVNSHSLRHLFGREYAEQNINDLNLATMLGHANVNSSRIYTLMHGTKIKEEHAKYYKGRKFIK